MHQRVSLAGHSVLVAEDEPLLALDLSTELEDAGAQVYLARSVKNALDCIEKHRLSAAILDHVFVDGDSAELCRQLEERDIPYLSYSGWERIDGVCEEGEHVSKPTHPAVIIGKVAALVAEKRA
jgi:DNA-binding response OmpR family regulator